MRSGIDSSDIGELSGAGAEVVVDRRHDLQVDLNAGSRKHIERFRHDSAYTVFDGHDPIVGLARLHGPEHFADIENWQKVDAPSERLNRGLVAKGSFGPPIGNFQRLFCRPGGRNDFAEYRNQLFGLEFAGMASEPFENLTFPFGVKKWSVVQVFGGPGFASEGDSATEQCDEVGIQPIDFRPNLVNRARRRECKVVHGPILADRRMLVQSPPVLNFTPPILEPVLSRLSVLFEPSWRGLTNVVDILLVTFVIYRLLKLVRGGRAWRIVLGLAFFVAALAASDALGLRTLHWILDKATLLAPVALVILFLPELRQAIDSFARLGLWSGRLIGGETSLEEEVIEQIAEAVEEMAEDRTGALIVIERSNKLDDIAENGVPVHAQVTAPLLIAMFYEGNPLHDGAVVIRRNELLAAACRLPLSESDAVSDKYHMRHRAGVGMSEVSDAVVLIVSEERGQIHFAIDGELIFTESGDPLRERLRRELIAPKPTRPKKRRKPRVTTT